MKNVLKYLGGIAFIVITWILSYFAWTQIFVEQARLSKTQYRVAMTPVVWFLIPALVLFSIWFWAFALPKLQREARHVSGMFKPVLFTVVTLATTLLASFVVTGYYLQFDLTLVLSELFVGLLVCSALITGGAAAGYFLMTPGSTHS